MSEDTTALRLPSRIETVDEAAAMAVKLATESGLSEEAVSGVEMAVREAVANAVVHGNALSETKTVEVTFTNSATTLVVLVRDSGAGFDPTAVPDPTLEQNLLKSSGRGLLFMRLFMDEVEWTRHAEGGTMVRMTKKL